MSIGYAIPQQTPSQKTLSLKSTIQSNPITEDTLTQHLHCVPPDSHSHSHLQYSQTPSQRTQYSQTPSQRTLSLNISTVFTWLALSLTSAIQSHPITEDTLTQHLHCVPLAGTLTHIYNTVRPHQRGHSHSASPLCSPGWHPHSHLQYSQTPSQRTLSLNISTVFTWLALSLTSAIQSDLITEDTIQSDHITEDTIQSDLITEDTIQSDLITEDTIQSDHITEDTIQSDLITEDNLTQHLHCVPWLALPLTSTIQSDLITEDTITQHLHCVPLTGTLTHIHNTVRPHHRGHSHSTSPLCFPGWHSQARGVVLLLHSYIHIFIHSLPFSIFFLLLLIKNRMSSMFRASRMTPMIVTVRMMIRGTSSDPRCFPTNGAAAIKKIFLIELLR